ncbi:hypothetical protein PPH41_23560, partial [Burkholderia gladioli]|nr:hypothetical protein [Burkholderia gladioli]
MTTTSLLIRDIRTLDGARADILVTGSRIAAIGPALAPPPGCAIEDGALRLALPGLVEGHTHLDKTHWGLPWFRNEVGPRLVDRIEFERRWRAEQGHHAGQQSLALARAFLAAGTTRLRTHVDIDTEAGLKHLEGVLATREAMRGRQEIQIVAFPQSGVLARPGTEALLDAAAHNETVYRILESHGVKTLVKSKSMLTDECELREYLGPRGIEVMETDLGERIQQLDQQPPSHVVVPAVHKLRGD